MLSGQWVKGCESATCVKVFRCDDDIYYIGNTERRGTIWVTEDEWLQFVKAVKDGQFD